MCDIMDCVPTGEYAMAAETAITMGVESYVGPANFQLGDGMVHDLDSTRFDASGHYDFDEFGQSGSGTWSFNLSSADGGTTWTLALVFTGSWPLNETSGPLTCTQSGSGTDTTIVYNGTLGGKTVKITQSYQNNGPFQDPKLFFDGLPVGGKTAQLYVYNSAA